MSVMTDYSMVVQVPTDPLATGTFARWQMPMAGTLTAVYGSVVKAPTGASILVDIHKGGTTIFTTQTNRITIAAAAKDDVSDTIEVPDFALGDVFELIVDQVGSTEAGEYLTVTLAYEGDTTP